MEGRKRELSKIVSSLSAGRNAVVVGPPGSGKTTLLHDAVRLLRIRHGASSIVLLESGMCLVDTPGIGSVIASNTETTRRFLPHIDAAIIVLGADPPMTGDELALAREVAERTPHFIFVLNKADRFSAEERREAIEFSARVLKRELGRPIGSIHEVSATERLAGLGSPLGWEGLIGALQSLGSNQGNGLLKSAEARAVTRVSQTMLLEFQERSASLLRPASESKERVARLRRITKEAGQWLSDLDPLFAAEQERLTRRLTEERDRYFANVLPQALGELRGAVSSEDLRGPRLRKRGMDLAAEIMKRKLERWRTEKEPEVEALYRAATSRFVDLLRSFMERAAPVRELAGLAIADVEWTFRAKGRMHYTEMWSLASPSFGEWLADFLLPRSLRASDMERDAGHYMERLFEANSARIKNDFEERVSEERARMQGEIRNRLGALLRSAEKWMAEAERLQAQGASAVGVELRRIEALRERVESVFGRRRTRPDLCSAVSWSIRRKAGIFLNSYRLYVGDHDHSRLDHGLHLLEQTENFDIGVDDGHHDWKVMSEQARTMDLRRLAISLQASKDRGACDSQLPALSHDDLIKRFAFPLITLGEVKSERR